MDMETGQGFETLHPPAPLRKENDGRTESGDVSFRTRSGERKSAPVIDTPKKRKQSLKSDSGSNGDRRGKGSPDLDDTGKRLKTSENSEDSASEQGMKRKSTHNGDGPRKRQMTGDRQKKRGKLSELDQKYEESVEGTSSQKFQTTYQQMVLPSDIEDIIMWLKTSEPSEDSASVQGMKRKSTHNGDGPRKRQMTGEGQKKREKLSELDQRYEESVEAAPSSGDITAPREKNLSSPVSTLEGTSSQKFQTTYQQMVLLSDIEDIIKWLETSEPSEDSASVQGMKRKSTHNGDGPRKRHMTSDPKSSEDIVRVKETKWEASENGDGQRKREKLSELDQRYEESVEAAPSSGEVTAPREKNLSSPVSTLEETSSQKFQTNYQQMVLLSDIEDIIKRLETSEPSEDSASVQGMKRKSTHNGDGPRKRHMTGDGQKKREKLSELDQKYEESVEGTSSQKFQTTYQQMVLPSDIEDISKRLKTSEPSEDSASVQGMKRKSTHNGDGPRKRQMTSDPESSEDIVRVKETKWEASENGDGQNKREKLSELDQRYEESVEAASSSGDITAPREKNLSSPVSTLEETSSQKFQTTYQQMVLLSDIEDISKRLKTSEPSEDSASVQGMKRKSTHNGDGPRKRQMTCDPESSQDIVSVKETEWEASENGDGQRKTEKVSELDQIYEGSVEAAPSSGENLSTPTSTSEGTSSQKFQTKYQQMGPLGEGGHGTVFAGYRREDNFPVAIKHIPRKNVICKSVSKNRKTLPLEVAVMIKMASGAAGLVGKSASISLLDYYNMDQELILVLERPVSSVDLFDYTDIEGGSLQEEDARLLLKQLVEAARELQSKGIFHRDIKMENILIETSTPTPRLRLIDFGLSCFTKKTSLYKIFYGTSAHIPPEWYHSRTYRAGPTTVWQVGVVLYDMLHSHTRFETTMLLSNRLDINKELSPNCQDVLRLCLAVDPQERPSLEQLRNHPWLA